MKMITTIRLQVLGLLICMSALKSLSNKLPEELTDEEKILSAAQEVLRSHSSAHVVEQLLKDLSQIGQTTDDNGCKCVQYNCGCCSHLNIHPLHINDNACVNASYLPHDFGIRLTMNIGTTVLLNTTVSARNPPPICFGVPMFKKAGSLCVGFYNLDVSRKHMSGCIRLLAKLAFVTVAKLNIGCFNIPLNDMEDYHRAVYMVQNMNAVRNETLSL